MAITTQNVKIDLNTGKTVPVVYAHQNDTNRAIQFQVFNNGEAFSLSGYTVKFGYVSPKKNGQYITINGDGMASGVVSGNTVTITLPETYTSISGTGLLTMIISGTGSSIRPVNIRFAVQTSADGSDVMAGASDFPDAWMDEKIYSWLDDHIDGIFTEEQFADSVDDWLDDHPEATTTVEDGSITKAKLDTSLKKAVSRVVDTFEDLYNTTEDEVTVLEDNSYYGSGQTVTFMKADNVLASSLSHLQRANGDYMVPKPNGHPESSDVPTQAIGEVVASYINRPEIVYGGNGAFSTSCDSEMDCSIFAQLVLQGISYEHSRYVEGNDANIFGGYVGNNIPKNKASLMASTRTTGYNTTELALWLAEQNRLHYLDYTKEHPCSQLQVGDVLFESDPNGEIGESYIAERYLYINHIVVVLAVYPEDDRIIVAQAGSSHTGQEYTQSQGANYRRDNIRISTLKIGDNPTKHVVFGRPKYGIVSSIPTSVPSGMYFNPTTTISPTTGAKQIAQVFLNQPLNPHKMYTLVVKGKLPQYDSEKSSMALFRMLSGSNQEMAVTWHNNCGDEIAIPFVPITEVAEATSLPIRVYYASEDASTAEENSYRADAVGLYEGLCPSASPNFEKVDDSIMTAENGVTISNKFFWKDSGKIHLRFNVALGTAVSADGSKDVVQLNLGAIGTAPARRFFTCYYDGQPRLLALSTTNMLSVTYASGEGAAKATYIDIVI